MTSVKTDLRNNQFWLYNEAIVNFIPGQKNLKQPRPDHTIGPKYDVDDPDDDFLTRAT